MLADHTLEMLHGLRPISARQLELRQAYQRALGTARYWKLDDDALVVALGIRRGRRECRSPIERLDVPRRALWGRRELPGNDGATFLPAALDNEPLRGEKGRVRGRAVRLRGKNTERNEGEAEDAEETMHVTGR